MGQLTHLVGDLMEVSRAITGRIQLRLEQTTVSGIVERAGGDGSSSDRPAKTSTHGVAAARPRFGLYADASRLEQVVTNLLANAAKYTNEGGHIWLSVQQEGGQSGAACTGYGASASLPLSCPTSSTCSRNRNGHPTVRRTG